MPTPTDEVPGLSEILGVDLRIKRDDLFPVPGGGNKGRKLARIFHRLDTEGVDAVVTTGGIRSNHARVTAQMAAARGWPCHLVLHGDRIALSEPRGNLLLSMLAGAKVTVVASHRIREKLEEVKQVLHRSGHRPHLIPGGGHSVEGGLAYVAAVEEVQEQLTVAGDDWQPEWLIVPSGTGATQAGLMVGLRRVGWSTRVVGISVARDRMRGRAAVDEMVERLEVGSMLDVPTEACDFRDDWTGGGYEEPHPDVPGLIRDVAKTSGIPLDPTYSGKGFLGMREMIRTGEIRGGSRVLFWHTGGLLNLVIASGVLKEVR